MRKILLPILILVMIIQLLVPSYMIWNRYDVLKNGEEVKFKVSLYDPYDAFRGRYVSIDVDNEWGGLYEYSYGRYGVLKVDEKGFAKIESVSEKVPEGKLYITSSDEDYFYFPHDRYYMEETLAPKAEKAIEKVDNAYITVRIKNGKSVISGLYINGIPVEEYVSE